MGRKDPDFTTVWLFRDAMTKAQAIKPLFDTFVARLEAQGVITKAGTIVDASFVEVPRQRNTRQENETLKRGEVPQDWTEQPHKLSQKDVDARWTEKNAVTFYGYKNHVRADADSLIITDYVVTDAAVHDSQVFTQLIDEDNRGETVFADSAYQSAACAERLAQLKISNLIHEKGVRNRPLNELQKGINRIKSRVRCTIEHIFGFVQNSMGGPELEYIGLARISTGIGLTNLAYNLLRYVRLIKLGHITMPATCA
jgi:IS5 family transposase